MQYYINREDATISALSSTKIDKVEYLTGEEFLPYDHSRMIEQAKFTYFLLGKTFEKQDKTFETEGKKQIKAIEDHGKKLNLMHALKKIVCHLVNKKLYINLLWKE